MSELTYPRLWWAVWAYSDRIEEVEFCRETESTLFRMVNGHEVHERKHSKSTDWYSTREQAEAIISNRQRLVAERQRINAKREMADEMIVALRRSNNAMKLFREQSTDAKLLTTLEEQIETNAALISRVDRL